MSALVISDRDGTLIHDGHYLSDPKLVSVIPGVASAIELLEKAKIDIIVSTNQSGVARGYFNEESVIAVNQRCQRLIDPEKKVLKSFFYCTHGPNDNCKCRKPLTGMVDKFLLTNTDKYERIYVVGDRLSDLELAINLQAVPVLVLTGKGQDTYSSKPFSLIQTGCMVANSFYEAAQLIVEDYL